MKQWYVLYVFLYSYGLITVTKNNTTEPCNSSSCYNDLTYERPHNSRTYLIGYMESLPHYLSSIICWSQTVHNHVYSVLQDHTSLLIQVPLHHVMVEI